MAPALAALMLAAWLFIPGMDISPAAGVAEVALGVPLELRSSPMTEITKFAVYADGELLALEYNLGASDLVRDFSLKAGQRVRVEAKATSLLGINREFVSEFDMVSPLTLEEMTLDGSPLAAGRQLAPSSDISLSFNKPVAQASISLDGGEALELTVDPADPAVCHIPAEVSFPQGMSHLLTVDALAADSAVLARREIRVDGVLPLTLSGRVSETGEEFRVELYASTGFADPQAVKSALVTTLPQAQVTVEPQRIIITCPAPDPAGSYAIRLAEARGSDGSTLEAPLALTVAYSSASEPAAAQGDAATRGYIYSDPVTAASPASGGSSAQAPSGPPPGWPSCHPWPPE